MAYILHIDTATDTGLYLLSRDGQVVLQKDSGSNRDHAATLSELTAALLQEAQLTFQDIAAFAVNGGPGSYTGLRIGLAAAKGYCFALQKPLLLENRLSLLLHTRQLNNKYNNTIAVLPARAGEYFAAAMDASGKYLLEPQHLMTEELKNWLQEQAGTFSAIGAVQADLMNLFPDITPPCYIASVWATLAGQQFKAGHFTDVAAAEPYYLKAAFTTQRRKPLPGKGL